MDKISKIAFGGGCHWCTEAVFQSVKGVNLVEQGFVASSKEYSSFSEAVIVHFDPNLISLRVLIEIHLHTHKSASDHSMRSKYRSGIYSFSESQREVAEQILVSLKFELEEELITKVYPFRSFRPSESQFKNYYLKNPRKPFCQKYIHPKLNILLRKFSDKVNSEKVNSLMRTV